jgi:hypothetical protein
MSDERLTKVHIDLPNHWATGGESMWARDLGADRYRLENVPFYAYGLNFHDVVEARSAAPDLKPSVLRVTERSGHRTIRVLFHAGVSEADRIAHLSALHECHVTFERCSSRYFALDLEPDADVDDVRARLDVLEVTSVLEYETCEARVSGSFDAAPGDETATDDAPAS